ncbi:MAG: hypothetical protein JNK52_13590 [Zoogloeaceae bacterium]|nr:hypothetical protein [Zoogloeaceae bacterium]
MSDPLQKLSAVAEVNGAALKSMVEIVLDTSEAMFELNLSVARALSTTGRESLVAGLREPGESGSHAHSQAIDLGAEYARNLNDILSRAQSQITRVQVEQMNDLSRSLRALVEGLASDRPAGGADMLEQVQVAMTQVSEAYAQLFQVARDIVANSMETGDEALQPGLAATPPRRSARKAA